MLVRFTKNPPVSAADSVLCVRTDASTTGADMPRQGILPHLAFHFVVESTLGWRDALFGRAAAGEPLASSRSQPIPSLARVHETQALQCEALIECLEAEQWAGASHPADFAEKLIHACRRLAIPPPDITADELARVRLALRDFGAAWRPLRPGASLERTF